MDKLTFQDTSFLRLESPQRPFHVGGLMIFKLPPSAPKNYLRTLARKCGRLNELWPIFNKQLRHPEALNRASWVPVVDYQPNRHILHYALPAPGRMEDLIHLVCCAHEQLLDRCRPLWEMHLIEGLSGNRFALYCKVHHALVDGVGALQMIDDLFSTSPQSHIDFRKAKVEAVAAGHAGNLSLRRTMEERTRGMFEQYSAMPELSALLTRMGVGALLGKDDTMALPFTAPRTLFNTEIDSRRRAVLCDLPFKSVQGIARRADATINDVLLAMCGGALRHYLLRYRALPDQSLIAGMPVSLKSAQPDAQAGNQLSFILCPFFTDVEDDLLRLQNIKQVTREAKREISQVSTTASRDFANLMMMPTIALTLSGNATRVRPAINAIFSNVTGSRQKLYLEGAELEALYPLSVLTDAMAINLTVVSYTNKLCFAITSCPTQQPDIEQLGELLKQSYRDLQAAVRQS